MGKFHIIDFVDKTKANTKIELQVQIVQHVHFSRLVVLNALIKNRSTSDTETCGNHLEVIYDCKFTMANLHEVRASLQLNCSPQ